ncbi:hypothetical protein [Ammoniphilus sp. YIM 78166]|uniref:hypothetical protein n=1 Tax=Ammoniphilus sp. YIM 78166 TaxID=1644106 RepID=UPI001431D206|nr:hypothetical protein [Ammoniphilus sp. YIM 78166]
MRPTRARNAAIGKSLAAIFLAPALKTLQFEPNERRHQDSSGDGVGVGWREE